MEILTSTWKSNSRLLLKMKNGGYPGVTAARHAIVLLLGCVLCFSGCKETYLDGIPDGIPDGLEPIKAESEVSAETAASVPNFTIVIMPDTQHYTSELAGGNEQMFQEEIDWILNNKSSKNIVYVLGVGDITQYGDRDPGDYVKAKNGYYQLEAAGIPYGLAIGNHDQWPQNYPLTGTTDEYNRWFGVSHFSGKSYYGGHYGGDNDSHYDLFSASGEDFIVIYIEYDKTDEDRANMNTWAYNLLGTYSSRKAIIVTHYLMGAGNPGSFSSQGRSIYERIKTRPNVFMMIGGHISGPGPHDGEGYREDVYNGNIIRSYLIDYQGYDKVGKGGYLRFMQFSINANDVIHKTHSPYLDQWEKDADSYFTRPLFGDRPVAVLPDGKYKLIAKHTGKGVVVKGASNDNNAKVIQYTYSNNGTDNDEWNFVEIGTTGYYKILNAKSGKAMVVAGAATDWGAGIIQYTYSDNGTRNDEWTIYEVEPGYYKIVNRRTGLCLKAKGTANGDQCVQSGYQLLDEEKFQILPVN